MALSEARKARARATVEASVQTGECTIRVDPEGKTDDTFNETTLTLSKPTGDDTTVYTGPFSIRPVEGLAQRSQTEGGADQFFDTYGVRLLAAVTTVQIGMVLTVDNLDDPGMIGRDFTISKVLGGTNAITRILLVQARARGPRF